MIHECKTPLGNRVRFGFLGQAKMDVVGTKPAQYFVRFIDPRSNENVYETTIETGRWCSPNPKYFVPWRIQVSEDGQAILDYRLRLEATPVLITLDSQALGDTIAWLPVVEQFQKKHSCRAYVCTSWNELFEANYPELHWIKPGVDTRLDLFASYTVGCYDNDYNRNWQNWRTVPIQQIASDCLGLEYQCEKPRMVRSRLPTLIEKPYVAISEFAVGYYAKLWLYPGGWQAVVDRLTELGYAVVSISKEESQLERVIKSNGRTIQETIHTIQHASLYIGVSSGPSYIAWALGVPTLLVSGFTEKWAEVDGVTRAINESACHGCFNDHTRPIDRANPHYCPRGQNLACTRSITPEQVIRLAEGLLAAPAPVVAEPKGGRRVLLIVPHCSTGGGPQYWLWQARRLIEEGHTVAMVEYKTLSDEYTVQREQLQDLLGSRFHAIQGEDLQLFKILETFAPNVVHLHDPAEWMLGKAATRDQLFARPRTYSIVQTLHTSAFNPEDVLYWPDRFEFVSQYHARLFKESCDQRNIPIEVKEYEVASRERPGREMALKQLGCNPNRKHVLQVGLFCPWKNQAQLFHAAGCLPDIDFHFVGNQAPNFRDYWEPLMKSAGPNIHVWGERKDVDRFYAAMDLLVVPSLKECFPIVIKEALSWHMPVLLRNLRTYADAYDATPGVTYLREGEGSVQIRNCLHLCPTN